MQRRRSIGKNPLVWARYCHHRHSDACDKRPGADTSGQRRRAWLLFYCFKRLWWFSVCSESDSLRCERLSAQTHPSSGAYWHFKSPDFWDSHQTRVPLRGALHSERPAGSACCHPQKSADSGTSARGNLKIRARRHPDGLRPASAGRYLHSQPDSAVPSTPRSGGWRGKPA